MGVKVGDLSVNCLLFANDEVLIASSECELQALVTTKELKRRDTLDGRY